MELFVPKAITASAMRARSTPKSTGSTKRISQWQADALAYYDQIGAVRYAAQFQARALPKIRWFAATRDESGEVTESEDPKLLALFDRVQDPGGGRSVMFATYGQLSFLCGEMYLLWSQANPEDGDEAEETWEIVSTLELKNQGKRGGQDFWHRIKAPGLTPQQLLEAEDGDFEPVGDNVQVYRWWTRHPAYSLMADAPMRSVLAECEEIVRATHSINARLISRLAGPGILAIPKSWSMKPLQQVVGEENPEEDPFQARLAQAMITAIGKPGSAESVAPIVVRVPDPGDGRRMDDLWSLIKIWQPDEVIRELELREKALQRFAVGVDMPPEKVMGLSTSGTQHWNAWMVDEDAWAHIDPVAQSLADNLASSYLRPAAKDEGIAEWQNVCVGYDPAEILTNPMGSRMRSSSMTRGPSARSISGRRATRRTRTRWATTSWPRHCSLRRTSRSRCRTARSSRRSRSRSSRLRPYRREEFRQGQRRAATVMEGRRQASRRRGRHRRRRQAWRRRTGSWGPLRRHWRRYAAGWARGFATTYRARARSARSR
jgi:hypothetical protein